MGTCFDLMSFLDLQGAMQQGEDQYLILLAPAGKVPHLQTCRGCCLPSADSLLPTLTHSCDNTE